MLIYFIHLSHCKGRESVSTLNKHLLSDRDGLAILTHLSINICIIASCSVMYLFNFRKRHFILIKRFSNLKKNLNVI